MARLPGYFLRTKALISLEKGDPGRRRTAAESGNRASGIGPGGAADIHALIAALPRDLTMVVIEHDLDLAFAIADRIAIMDRGRIIFDGPPEAARPALTAIYDA